MLRIRVHIKFESVLVMVRETGLWVAEAEKRETGLWYEVMLVKFEEFHCFTIDGARLKTV